jgi:hypothetical protein
MPSQTLDRAALLDNVRRLRDAPSPALEDAERILTDGYACVMQTETERLRLRNRLEERAGSLPAAPGDDEVVEITVLAQGIARADDEIEELRAALGGLAARVRRLRVA